MKNKGLVILYTGNGKGKSTAAFGQALRAAGHGFRVAIIQFIKSNLNTGEARLLADLANRIEFNVTGSGFTWQAADMGEVRQAAARGWRLAREKLAGGDYDMVILDELTYLINYDLVEPEEILNALRSRPEHVDVVITGRDASRELIGVADLVTEMKEIKHPYAAGVRARKGIEY